jgi:hypothetical protein
LAQVEFDARWFPLVVQRWPPALSDAELQTFFETNEEVARRALCSNTFYAVVVGPRAAINAAQRRRVAKWARDMPRELRERIVGAFVVLGSPMQRGALSALRWFLPELKDVFAALDSLEGAVKHALAALESKGVVVPGRPGEIWGYIEQRACEPVR